MSPRIPENKRTDHVPARRSPDDVTLFSSQGFALEDFAAARLVYDGAKKSVGREIHL